jgi:Meiotically Up-regulated Gene 113 (MUG113) protein
MKNHYFSPWYGAAASDWRFGTVLRTLRIGKFRFSPRYRGQSLTFDVLELDASPLPLFSAPCEADGVDDNIKTLRAAFGRPELQIYEDKTGVYFLSDGEYCKIGSTTNLKQRISMHFGSYPKPLKILKVWCGSMILENLLKALLRDFHVNGEWFCIPQGMITALCRIESADDFEGMAAAGRLCGIEVHWSEDRPESRTTFLSGQNSV